MGIADAIRTALANATRRPNEVGYINAWGTGHRFIDLSEARALQKAFGSHLANIPVSSIKGAIGTALGASGPIQSASTIISLMTEVLPPTVNWETSDPGCPLNLSNTPRRVRTNVAVVNAHGLSGSNSALVLERE
jgi:3-oxoacyl-(acyl-carrier-protein) synthase